jgi:hypothetical protein
MVRKYLRCLFRHCVLVGAVSLCLETRCAYSDPQWVGPLNGTWSTSSNWSPASPGFGAVVILNSANSRQTIMNTPETLSGLTFSSATSLGELVGDGSGVGFTLSSASVNLGG